MDEIQWLDNPKPEPRCWDCGAANDPGSSECWLCQRRDWNRYPHRRTRGTPLPDLSRRRPLSTIAGLMIGIAVLALAIAIFREMPGLGIVLLISVLPALVITEVKARRRDRLGRPMSLGERALRIVVLTIVIPILVIVALGIALFTFCVFFMR